MNRVELMGRLARDPQVWTTGDGLQVCNFVLACDRRSRDNGADFPNCKAFGKTAETISKYCGKGKQIAVEGHLQTGSYESKDGRKVYYTEVIVDHFDFCGKKADNEPVMDMQGPPPTPAAADVQEEIPF